MILTKAIKYKLLEYSLNTFFSKVYENILNNNPIGLKGGDYFSRITYTNKIAHSLFTNCVIIEISKISTTNGYYQYHQYTHRISFKYEQHYINEFRENSKIRLIDTYNKTHFSIPDSNVKFIK